MVERRCGIDRSESCVRLKINFLVAEFSLSGFRFDTYSVALFMSLCMFSGSNQRSSFLFFSLYHMLCPTFLFFCSYFHCINRGNDWWFAEWFIRSSIRLFFVVLFLLSLFHCFRPDEILSKILNLVMNFMRFGICLTQIFLFQFCYKKKNQICFPQTAPIRFDQKLASNSYKYSTWFVRKIWTLGLRLWTRWEIFSKLSL